MRGGGGGASIAGERVRVCSGPGDGDGVHAAVGDGAGRHPDQRHGYCVRITRGGERRGCGGCAARDTVLAPP